MSLPNRYHSKAKLYISPIADGTEAYWEEFSDIQMAYLRVLQIIKSTPSDWDDIASFPETANRLDERIIELGIRSTYICFISSDMEIYMYYAESLL